MSPPEVDAMQIMPKRFANAQEFWRRFRKNRAGVFGLVVTICIALVALMADVIVPFNPYQIGVGTRLTPPSLYHLMGTDGLGRDTFSAVIHGSRISLMVGLLAATTSTTVGTLVGATAGFLGGKVDEVIMRIVEYFQVIPRFFLALVLASIFGASVWNLIVVIGILSWPETARLVRSQYLSLKEQEFVEAARADGSSSLRIMFSEILPNASPPIIVSASLLVATAILLEAGLSFLGVGDPNVVSWGAMLFEGQRFIRAAWWLTVFPGAFIFIAVLSLNLMGDGLNDALNPRLKER